MSFSACFNTNDQSIGPSVLGCRGDFDFTVKFEQLFLSLTPAVAFVVLSLCRTIILVRKPTIVDAPLLLLAKLGAVISYASIELSLLILVGIRSFDTTSIAIAASSLRLVAALCMIGLSFFDHNKSPRPSLLLSAYLFLTLLFDVAQVRTNWLASTTRPEVVYSAIFTTSFVIKILIILLEAQQKTKWIRWDSKEHSPEETSGIYSLGIYFWLHALFLDGYRKVLQIRDLYPLDNNMTASDLYAQFSGHLDESKLRSHKYSLVKIMARSLVIPLLLPIPPRIALIGFTFGQPFFISTLVGHLAEPDTEAKSKIGYGLIGASALIYTGIAVSSAFYWYFHYRMLYMARGTLVSAIYTKATEARIGAADQNASLTLMSTDIEQLIIGFRSLHEFWANTVEVALAGWLLYNILGAAFAVPIVIVLVVTIGISVITRFTAPGQRMYMSGIQKRVGLTASVIGQMKNLKISGLSSPIASFVQKLRVDELAAGSKFRKNILGSAVLAFVPLTFSPFLTFAIAQRSLDAARLFTSLSYLLLMTRPLTSLFQALPRLIAAFTCLGRIQAFLACETRRDFRTLLTNRKVNCEKVLKSIDPAINGDTSAGPAVVVRSGSFGWLAEKMILRNINLVIPKGSLTLVVGPIASGKSTLAKALLGEIPYNAGTVSMENPASRVGYCDQTAFLSNGSIRDNIIGFSPLDTERYSAVIDATMLAVDFETLPQADDTNVGSNGISLSGGQKQRISLARTLYLQADIVILDDVLSGLDADTEDQVFLRVFGANGILRRRRTTIVFCTHSVRHCPAADHIIALGLGGNIVEQGCFEDLVAHEGYVKGLDIRSSSASERSTENIESINSMTPKGPEPETRSLAKANLPDVVDKARQQGDRSVYIIYFKSMGLWIAGGILLSGLSNGFLNSFSTVWLKFWADDVAATSPGHPFSFWVGIYAFLQVNALVTLFLLALLVIVTAVVKSGASLHQLALNTLIHARLRFFTTTDQGVITNLFSQDLELIDNQLPNALLNTVAGVFSTLGSAAVIATSSPYLTVSYPFLVAVLWIIQKFYLRTSRQLRLLDLEAKSPLYTHFLDTIRGIVTMRAFGFVQQDREKNMALLDTSQRPAYLLIMIQHWLQFVLNCVVALIAVLLTALATQLRSNSGFTGASLVTLMTFGSELSDVVQFYTLLETSIGAVARIKSFSENVKAEELEGEDVVPPEEWPPRGEVSFRGVSASYGNDEPTDEPPMALKNVELFIQSREKVAICGRTGSGKSSLVALILKLLDPSDQTADKVYIDNLALHRIDRQTLRRRIIAVPQDTVFLPYGSTFQANLDPFDAATAEESRSILETVDLWSFVAEHGGLGAGMTPDTLSHGQRQLFSLARAVLRRRIRARSLWFGGGGSEGGILLLDEMSSSVDRETEKAMQEVICVEFKEYTIVAVSHHLEMIMDFDRVVVMEKGEIIEVGNPRELAIEAGTRFAELCNVGGQAKTRPTETEVAG